MTKSNSGSLRTSGITCDSKNDPADAATRALSFQPSWIRVIFCFLQCVQKVDWVALIDGVSTPVMDLHHETMVTGSDMGSAPFSLGTKFSFASIRETLCFSRSTSDFDFLCVYFRPKYCKWTLFFVLQLRILGETPYRLKQLVVVQISEVTIYHAEHIRVTRFHWPCEIVKMRGTCLEAQKLIQQKVVINS